MNAWCLAWVLTLTWAACGDASEAPQAGAPDGAEACEPLACDDASDASAGDVGPAVVDTEPPELALVTEARASGLLKYLTDGADPTVVSSEGDTTVYAFGPDDGPLCMRGDTFRFSIRDTGSDNLLIFLQGGGACWSEFCLAVTAAPAGIPLVESLNPDNPSNPMADWSVLYLPYCDGSFFAGDVDVDEDGDGEGDRLHRGLQNLSGALRTIRDHFPSPARVLLTGSSAGGYGTIPASILVRATYPAVTLQIFNDSGVGLGLPGDPTFVETILEEQGIEPLVPETCLDCWKDGHITGLLHWMLERDPLMEIAVFSSLHDSVIAGVFLDIDEALFAEALLAETGELHARFPDRYRRFLVQGIEHTALLGDPTGIVGEDFAAV
ncbi:MAG: pectin acetylesterase-family hydrolase, partial [Myxococcota bacterium]|nr:pectin acetylesterase-family hydrolase [Myxococcota bacterium]